MYIRSTSYSYIPISYSLAAPALVPIVYMGDKLTGQVMGMPVRLNIANSWVLLPKRYRSIIHQSIQHNIDIDQANRAIDYAVPRHPRNQNVRLQLQNTMFTTLLRRLQGGVFSSRRAQQL